MIGIASRWQGTRIGSMAVSLLLAEAITKGARGRDRGDRDQLDPRN